MDIFSDLNENQLKAVKHTEGPLLVLAGAGAGKTRVITYRIAYLINSCGVNPQEILAVTFTNKAASEMKSRLSALAGSKARRVWMGTFHSIGLNMLRRFSIQAELEPGFGIVDQDDRLRIVREVVKYLGIDSKKHSVKNYLSLISDYKNTLLFVEKRTPDDFTHRFAEVFTSYQKELKNQRLIDFDDMLSITLRLLLNDADVLEYYRQLCKYILVDEYQDTNVIQFMFLQVLAGNGGNICVVGDDDQSIYGWRGAEVENILYFDSHFKNVTEIKLTENYRSAPEILDIANNIIKNNYARRGKDLKAASERQGEIRSFRTVDEVTEAEHVVSMIEEQLHQGVPENEIAILYRTNAQSRNFEVALNRRKIKYRVVGGVGFYQRREIKDILSYIRAYDNPYDESSFFRAAKTPPKGIGEALLDKLLKYVNDNHTDLLSGAAEYAPSLPPRQASALGRLINIMHGLADFAKVSDMVNYIIEAAEYKEYLIQSEDEAEAKVRMSNLEELYNAALSYEEQFPEGSLADFLSTATLVTSSDDTSFETVSLMSLHAAKGLEFESVFLSGVEEGIFPLYSQDQVDDIEEERRLCYVGVTRAKVYLTVTNASSRLIHGKRQYMKPSRFLKEMGFSAPSQEENNEKVKLFDTSDGLRKGQTVSHELFGNGIVMQVQGNGDSAKVDVMFKKHGIKKLIARFLKT